MKLEIKQYGDVIVLAPDGRIDHTNCDSFGEQIEPHVERCRASGIQLVFDLSGLDYISSAGLRCFLVAAKHVNAHGGNMVVAALRPVVGEIFEISRFNLVFPIYATVREALAQLSPQALDALDAA